MPSNKDLLRAELAKIEEEEAQNRKRFLSQQEQELDLANRKAYKIQFCTDYAIEVFDLNETMAKTFAKDWIEHGHEYEEFNNFHTFVQSKLDA